MLLVANATLYTPTERSERGAVLMDAGRIVAVGPADEVPRPAEAQALDAAGLLAAPGFIDLQLNGAFGRDVTADPDAIWDVAAQLPRYGVTAFLPTVITSPPEQLARAQAVLAAGPPPGWRGATPLGLHVEGPFLNPAKKGAHNPAYLRMPTLDAVADWSPQTGVRLVTLAPELSGALPVAEALSRRGVLVGAGHSAATYEQALAGFDAGVRYGTHLFNAMPPLLHRDPGLAAALLTDPRITVGLIVDGVHVHPAVVRLAWRALGPGRLNLVTDAMAALGMPPGHYCLGDFPVAVDGAVCRLADGTLAGSVLSLDQALRNLIAFAGCRLEDALQTVTVTPARALGLAHQRGRLAVGCAADLVLLSPDLRVRATIVAGELVYAADPAG
ncbi:MAG: N-acetylglucosamine-6-phosphate deacetylase [Caldilineales bacterium]|nr:N-acetylglucosamine-6-phosphate deacetylase [Caldilineales bacterium]MDW8316325.1 N-acetylglucosamine-6-phosphate deacetylase [Anaerolineae bacterium]